MNWRGLLLVVILSLAGCSDPPRLNEAVSVDKKEQAPLQNSESLSAPAPARSDEEALKIVRAALDAHTSKKPELLDKLKMVTIIREGKGLNATSQLVPQKHLVRTAWPDRSRFQFDIAGSPTFTVALTEKSCLYAVNNERQSIDAEQERVCRVDALANWYTMLLPLRESNLIAVRAEAATIANRPAVGVQVWLPNYPTVILHFDKETQLLRRVMYRGWENRQLVVKELIFLDQKPYHGITLDRMRTLRIDNVEWYEMTTNSVEINDSFGAKMFEMP